MKRLFRLFASATNRRPLHRKAPRLTVEALETREVLNAALLGAGVTAPVAPDFALSPAFTQTPMPPDLGVVLVNTSAAAGNTLRLSQDSVALAALPALGSADIGDDIASLTFRVMQEAARDAQQDLKSIMEGINHSTSEVAALSPYEPWSDWR
jgi:hypothetical protein